MECSTQGNVNNSLKGMYDSSDSKSKKVLLGAAIGLRTVAIIIPVVLYSVFTKIASYCISICTLCARSIKEKFKCPLVILVVPYALLAMCLGVVAAVGLGGFTGVHFGVIAAVSIGVNGVHGAGRTMQEISDQAFVPLRVCLDKHDTESIRQKEVIKVLYQHLISNEVEPQGGF